MYDLKFDGDLKELIKLKLLNQEVDSGKIPNISYPNCCLDIHRVIIYSSYELDTLDYYSYYFAGDLNLDITYKCSLELIGGQIRELKHFLQPTPKLVIKRL